MALSIDDYLLRPYPTEAWIIDQLLPLQGATYLYGSPKIGKSLLGLGMGIAISDGHDKFLGFDVLQHGRVLYVQVDMGPTLFRNYVTTAMEGGHTLKNFYFIDRWELPDNSLNILKNKHRDWLKAEIDRVQPIVVFLDTFRTIHSENENDNSIMSNVYEKILQVMGTISFVIIHHQKKPGLISDIVSDARGATSISGKVDVIAQLGGTQKKKKLQYLTRAESKYPDGMSLVHNKVSGLFEVRLTPETLMENYKRENPLHSAKELVDYLIEHGVPRSSAYKLVG